MNRFTPLLAALKSAGEPTRLRLIALLAEAELTVTEITQVLGQSQPRVSRHLKLLCEAGILERVREGAWAFYRISDQGGGADLGRFIISRLDLRDGVLLADHKRLADVRQARQVAANAYFAANAPQWARVRALYLPEGEVEAAILEMVRGRQIDDLVDLGTGTGRMLQVLGPFVRRGVGFDLSHEMLAYARVHLAQSGLSHCLVRHGDMLRLPFETGRGADAVILHQVLHYLENPAAALHEAARILKPGGIVLVADFAPHDLEFLREAHAHRRLGISERDIAQWAEGAGLAVLSERSLPPRAGDEKLTVRLWLLGDPVSATLTPAVEVEA